MTKSCGVGNEQYGFSECFGKQTGNILREPVPSKGKNLLPAATGVVIRAGPLSALYPVSQQAQPSSHILPTYPHNSMCAPIPSPALGQFRHRGSSRMGCTMPMEQSTCGGRATNQCAFACSVGWTTNNTTLRREIRGNGRCTNQPTNQRKKQNPGKQLLPFSDFSFS